MILFTVYARFISVIHSQVAEGAAKVVVGSTAIITNWRLIQLRGHIRLGVQTWVVCAPPT